MGTIFLRKSVEILMHVASAETMEHKLMSTGVPLETHIPLSNPVFGNIDTPLLWFVGHKMMILLLVPTWQVNHFAPVKLINSPLSNWMNYPSYGL